jgi:Holliday junction resolvase RusA-like endonuclease
MSDPVIITLPLPPSVNGLFAGMQRRHLSPEYKAWRIEAGYELNLQRPRKCLGKVALAFEVREPPTRRAEDLSNRLKACEDLLVSHGIIEGDSQHFVRHIELDWALIEGIRITITAWEK